MSSSQRNIAIVQNIYAAFGRQDVPAILGALREDVDWEFGREDVGAPWLAPGHGHAAAVAFFQSLGENLDFKRFEVLSIMADGDWVVALCVVEAVHRTTGKRLYEACEPHVWRFDAEGRVAAYRHGADSYHQHKVHAG